MVVISYFDQPEDHWNPDVLVMGWPDNHEMYSFLAKSFREARLFQNTTFQNPVVSSDGRVRLYLRGFKDAVVNHGDDILDFLTQ